MLLLVFAPLASASFIAPEDGGSPNADDIDTLYMITLYVAIVIFLLVEGTADLRACTKFRAAAAAPRRRRSAATPRSRWAGRSARP